MTSTIQSSSKTTQKMAVVESLPSFIELIGAAVCTINPSILGLLSLCICHKFNVVEAIEKLMETLKDFGAVSVQVFVLLLDAYDIPNADKGRIDRVVSAIIRARQGVDYICRFPDASFNGEYSFAVEQAGLYARIAGLTENLAIDNDSLVSRTLATLKKLILNNELEIQSSFVAEFPHTSLQRLMQALFSANVKYHNTSTIISDYCGQCIGILGAIDPARLVAIKVEAMATDMWAMSKDFDVRRMATSVLIRYLAPAFKSVAPSKRHGLIAFTIQEILKFLNFTPENSGDLKGKSSLSGWNSLPKDVRSTIEPLLESRYSVIQAQSVPATFAHLIYPTSQTHKDWLITWVMKLYKSVRNAYAVQLMDILLRLICDEDTILASALLPHLFLNVIMKCDTTELLGECLCVLSQRGERHHISLQVSSGNLDCIPSD
jgi:hypothetical protein